MMNFNCNEYDVILFYYHNSTDVRIGFEQETYTTSEPTGAVQIEQQVCMVVLSGAIGRQVTIAVQWQPDTALSENNIYC